MQISVFDVATDVVEIATDKSSISVRHASYEAISDNDYNEINRWCEQKHHGNVHASFTFSCENAGALFRLINTLNLLYENESITQVCINWFLPDENTVHHINNLKNIFPEFEHHITKLF